MYSRITILPITVLVLVCAAVVAAMPHAYAGGGEGIYVQEIWQQNNTPVTPALFPCFLTAKETCLYNPNNPIVYFSLGDALAAFGLIFAAYQLQKPSWKIVLNIRPKWQSHSWWVLGLLGLSFALGAVLLPQKGFAFSGILNYPLLYEIIGFGLIIAAPLSLLWFANARRNKLFSAGNSRRFLQVLMSWVARPDPESLRVVVDIIGANLNTIAATAPRSYKLDEVDRKTFLKDVELQYIAHAHEVLSVLLSEPSVVRYIATSRYDFLYEYIRAIKRHRLSVQDTGLSFDRIMEELYINTGSYLYTQMRPGGLALPTPIFQEVFFDQSMLDQFKPHSRWRAWSLKPEELLNEDYLKVYLAATEQTIKGYFFDNKYKNYDRLRSPLSNLKTYLDALWSVQIREGSGVNEVVNERLGDVIHFIGHRVTQIYEEAIRNNKVSDDAHKCGNRYTAEGFAAQLAVSIYEAIEVISKMKMSEWQRRNALLDLTSPVMGISANTGKEFAQIRECLNELLWEKVYENIERGHFPAVMRDFLLLSDHFFLFSKEKVENEFPGFMKTDREKLIRFLEDTVKPELEKEEAVMIDEDKTPKAKALLPKSIRFHNGWFEHKAHRGDWEPIEK